MARVDVYADGAMARDRKWMAESTSIKAGVEFCDTHSDELRAMQSGEPLPEALGDAWEHHSDLDII